MIDLMSSEGEMPSRYRLTVYFSDEETLKALEEWSREENRSASNLAATILAKAIKERQKKTPITTEKNEEDK